MTQMSQMHRAKIRSDTLAVYQPIKIPSFMLDIVYACFYSSALGYM